MNPTPPIHDDGLEWLREVRARMLQQADGDFKKLGDRYRAVQSRHPEKTFDPHATIIRAVREKQSGQRRSFVDLPITKRLGFTNSFSANFMKSLQTSVTSRSSFRHFNVSGFQLLPHAPLIRILFPSMFDVGHST